MCIGTADCSQPNFLILERAYIERRLSEERASIEALSKRRFPSACLRHDAQQRKPTEKATPHRPRARAEVFELDAFVIRGMKRLSIITSGCAPPDLRWNASASRAAWIQRVRHYRRQGRAVQRARSDRQNVSGISELGSID